MEAHKAQENEEETEDRGDAYIQEVYTLRDIKGSSTGKRIDRKKKLGQLKKCSNSECLRSAIELYKSTIYHPGDI